MRVCFAIRSPLSIFQARFMAQNDGPTPPVICGKNSGHHMILDTREACNTLTFSWQSSPTRDWSIQVTRADYYEGG